MMGVIVRGDRIYDSDLQFDDYMAIYRALPPDEKHLVRLLICHNEVRGHDHFLDPQFDSDAAVIEAFLQDLPLPNLRAREDRSGSRFRHAVHQAVV
ncbi:hypothetical protein [Microvirga yunnanensis]|uniref:hypothetical protein n=1 Tax=Microvirga yunnanensis TaxID=2953740 RepID=UPI0021C6807E|nr:hypothetical protein [Microvirga sp. HBU65207]